MNELCCQVCGARKGYLHMGSQPVYICSACGTRLKVSCGQRVYLSDLIPVGFVEVDEGEPMEIAL